MQTEHSLQNYPLISGQELKEAYETAAALTREHAKTYRTCFPGSASKRGFYEKEENLEWTTGFFTGEVWLAYEAESDEELKAVGESHVDSFLNRIETKTAVNHHDMGFLYSPSCVAAWELTGNAKAKKAAVLAAENLLGRFREKGGFFQAWGDLGATDNYRLIIDCLLNMPLLFWASEVTGDARYKEKAAAHIRTAMEYVIRPDDSTYHTYFFDPETGKPLKGMTHQGYRDGSAWARGQAWGIYGSALAYRYLREERYKEIFERLTRYFLDHLPENLVPYWDFDFDDGSSEPRDSSASAIAICGMLEMAKYLLAEQAEHYITMAKRLLRALWTECAVRNPEVSDGLLLHGTYAKNSPYNTCQDNGVDECNTWGDYYYFEALTRLVKDWKPYW